MKQALVKHIRHYTTAAVRGPGFGAVQDMRLRGPWTYVEDLSPMQTHKMDATLKGHIPISRGTLVAGDAVPVGYHFAYFNGLESEEELTRAGCVRAAAPDPQLFPVRMWAGGSIEFNARPLTLGTVGSAIERVARVEYKCKSSGIVGEEENKNKNKNRLQERLFVTFERRMYAQDVVSSGGGFIEKVATGTGDDKWSVKEERTMVYMSNRSAPSKSGESPFISPKYSGPPVFQHTFTLSMVTLFRYSAVTFNGYRMHYDPLYCIEEEGLSGCLVHGPLIATVVLSLATQAGVMIGSMGRRIVRFRYRMVAPLLVEKAITVEFRELKGVVVVVCVTDQRGSQCVDGAIEFE
ncbi:uncharacterized protein SAPINGB_P002880 [Magnusiomyces paraingens]|uniref:MaoC-like domain-containing protein n=1 Tax=Magnusiomyces paraingens TaxID=2606893 RepID=A0A5E8BM87_9ASCO|nr:uncharacterized protein SAPINGB_P002880 [Saprochaete ingens]VVT50788.1 unnamed protein product [Saprochaete ingens]